MIVGTAKMITGIPTVIAGTPAVPILLLMQFIYLENFEESFLQFVPMGIASSFSCLGCLPRRGSALIDQKYR